MRLFFLLFFLLIFRDIYTQTDPSGQEILARIGDRRISVDEFIQRSELTVRPFKFKDKNITLNNLISEKILALEAERNTQLPENQVLQSRLKGIKEQLMREKLYYEEAFNKVELDSTEIEKSCRLSMREYELEFYRLKQKELVKQIETVIDSIPALTPGLFLELEKIAGEKPVHKVKYFDPDDDLIHKALYADLLDTGDVVGPVRISNGDYLLMKILKWTDYPVFGIYDQQIRWNKVKEKMHRIKADNLWVSYANRIMGDRKIKFNEETTELLADIAYDYYSKMKSDSLKMQVSEVPLPDDELNLDAVFFTVDNTGWTINDFKKELQSHPLVYRSKNLDESNFRRNFQLAVVDLIRDYYLTREAYKKSYDTLESINNAKEMWQDAFLASEFQIQIMNSAIEQGIVDENDNTGRLNYWQNYLVDLQAKYGDSIWLNTDELDKIRLTNIDFVALQSGVPYPVVVPRFPIFIPSENLDYAKKENSF